MQNNLKGATYQRYLTNIIILYKQRRDIKAYLELLLSLAAIALFIVFAIKPTIITITDLIGKIRVEEETVANLDTKIKNLGIAQNIYNSETNNISILNDAIPDNPNVSNYVRQVEGLAQQNSLNIISMNVNQIPLIESVASSSAQIMTTNVTLTGSYENESKFIKDIEKLRRPAFISKLNIINNSDGLNLTITPKVPYIQ